MTEFMTVKMLCNWDSGTGLCRTWDKLTDGNLTYTRDSASIKMVGDETPTDDADYILVVNLANIGQQSWYPSMDELPRVIFLKMEPGFMDPFWRDVDRQLLKAKIVHGSDHDHTNFNNLEWHINKTKDELLASDYSDLKTKGDVVSSVISGKAFTDGHKLRKAFALHAQNFMDWDAYGNYGAHNHAWNRYLGAPQYKDDALIPYKYSFACENTFINGYITEKLVDCIMSETLCFYCGAPNVSKFIDPKAYIQLDLREEGSWDAAIKTMKDAIANGEWEKRLVSIKKAKHKILTEMSMFPRLWDVIYAPEKKVCHDNFLTPWKLKR